MSSSHSLVNRPFDYFVTCGLDSVRGLVHHSLLDEHNARLGPLEASYSPEVLAHYPESVPWNTFDSSAVTTLCMPLGVHFSCVPKESQDNSKEPHFHPFIITKENGAKVFGFSLVFYEEVFDDSIINAVSSLQTLHSAQIMEIAPHNPSLGVFEEPSSNSKSLPRHFKVAKTRLYEKSKGTQPKFDPLRDSLLVTKCICLVGQFPLVDAARNFLYNFYRLAVHSSDLSTIGDHPLSTLSPESYIYYVLFTLHLPSPNQCLIVPNVPVLEWTSHSPSSETLIFQRPSASTELPLFEYDIGQVVDLLGIDNLIQLWTCLLLESQVLIHSQDYSRLMLVAESLTTLLFPFSWPHVYVPILPAAMYNFLDAPVPFLMGLRSVQTDDSRIPSEANLCMVDIDNCRITIPEDLPAFPQHRELADELREVLTKLQQAPTSSSSTTNKHRQSWSPLALASSSDASGVLERSEAFQRISAIAKRTGVFHEELSKADSDPLETPGIVNADLERYLRVQLVNNAVREIFLNQFAHMFSVYEYFFSQPNQDMESWMSNRDQAHPFDKTTFLSDQPGPHLRFMSCFLESQMFANFIDAKVLANYGQCCHSVRVLDARIRLLKDGSGESMVRTPGYEPCTWYLQMGSLLERRLLKATLNTVAPSEVLVNPQERQSTCRRSRCNKFYPVFPSLNGSILSTPPDSFFKNKKGDKSRKKEKSALHKSHTIGAESGGIAAETARGDGNPLSMPGLAARPAVIAQGNWKFVEQLLQECKTKTKRLLVGKMGSEAFELGHGQVSISGVEDNTLIAGLCDLLERVWAHGLQTKQGKSALWSHLLHYLDLKTATVVNKPVKASSQAQDFSGANNGEVAANAHHGTRTSHSADGRANNQHQHCRMRPLPVSLVFDMKNVQNMSDIKTHLGYARAWVRLCLEKKLLYDHLTTLLSEENLLRTLYKRYGFLRCEDERNLFLTYLLTLNAADYHSFTNTYTNSVITYRVLIVQARQSGMAACRPYVFLSGTLADTQPLYFGNEQLEFLFQHKNLGILTTLRIGLEDAGGSGGRWLIDYIVVRNEITGRAYKFPCSRWLGRDIEDGSTERLLVAIPCEQNGLPDPCASDNSGHVNGSPVHTAAHVGSRTRSPSATRSDSSSSLTSSLTNLAGNLNINLKGGGRRKASESEIQCLLGEAVNNLIKYYLEPTGERGSNVTALLCGESGLVSCLELVFHYGFRSSRIFSRNLFLWDYLLQVCTCYTQDQRSSVTSVRDYADPHADRVARRWLCDTIAKIEKYGHALGKRDKLQLFLCLAARDRMLHRIIGPLASCSATLTHYDENSYLREKRLRDYLQPLLQTLSEEKVRIVLEPSITRGID